MNFMKSYFPLKNQEHGGKGVCAASLVGFLALLSSPCVKQKKIRPSQSIFMQVQVKDRPPL